MKQENQYTDTYKRETYTEYIQRNPVFLDLTRYTKTRIHVSKRYKLEPIL